MRERLEQILDGFRPGFQADGMDVAVGKIDPAGVIEVKILLGPDACEECLMPPSLLADMFRAALRDAMPGLTHVEIVREKTVPD